MGCDIHFFTEVKQPDGSWKIIGTFGKYEDDGDDAWLQQLDGSLYGGRNYNLFAILADVRNGRGFAGIKTGEGFNPISEPRGVPQDASDTYKQIVAQWDGDGHSHSHHTLRQLLDYDWTQTTTCQGWCDIGSFLSWTARGDTAVSPKDYCGSVAGGGVIHLTDDEATALADQFNALRGYDARQAFIKDQSELGGQRYALAKWYPPYYYAADSFISETIPKLLSLAKGTAGLDDVRIVFFFDN